MLLSHLKIDKGFQWSHTVTAIYDRLTPVTLRTETQKLSY